MPSLAELLGLPELAGTRILTGAAFVGGAVSHVTVRDPLFTGQLPRPGELVLTSAELPAGSAWADVVSELSAHGAAGLLLQTGGGRAGRAELVRHAARSGLPVLQLTRPAPWGQLVEALSARLMAGKEQDVLEQVSEVILTGGDTEAILSRLAELTGSPVIFLSRQFEPIVWAPRAVADTAQVGRQLQRHLRYSDELLSRKVIDIGEPMSCCVSSVGTGSVRYGYLAVLSGSGPLTMRQRLAAQQGALALALYAMKEDAAAATERLYREALVHDLLFGRVALPELLARARRMGMPLAREYAVLVLAPDHRKHDSDGVLDSLSAAVARALSTLGLACPQATVADAVALLMPPAAEGTTVRVVERLREFSQRFLGVSTISVGVGRRADLPGLPASLDQARVSLSLGRQLWGSGIYEYERLGPYRFLDAVHRHPEVRRFFDQTLGQLWSGEDQPEAAELLHTLRVYFETHRSRQDCARRLFVHPNTVGYRLKKLERLTGLCLNRADHMFELQLALHMGEVLMARQEGPISDRTRNGWPEPAPAPAAAALGPAWPVADVGRNAALGTVRDAVLSGVRPAAAGADGPDSAPSVVRVGFLRGVVPAGPDLTAITAERGMPAALPRLPRFSELTDLELMAWSGVEFADRMVAKARSFGRYVLHKANYQVEDMQSELRRQRLAHWNLRHAWLEWWLGVVPPSKLLVALPDSDIGLKVRVAQQVVDEIRHQRIFSRHAERLSGNSRLEGFTPSDELQEMYRSTVALEDPLDIAASLQTTGEAVLLGQVEPECSIASVVMDPEMQGDIRSSILPEEERHVCNGRDIIARWADTPARRRRCAAVQDEKLRVLLRHYRQDYALLGAHRCAVDPEI